MLPLARENAGHYIITSYTEPADGSAVVVKVMHGADSNLPGIEVCAVHPETVFACNCGGWAWATLEQAEGTYRHLEAQHLAPFN